MINNFTGCILAGGLGTRLRPSVSDCPKVLAPVGGRPFLDYILNQFARIGIKQCILCTGYMADMIESNYGKSFCGMNLIYSKEETPLGTGGALAHASGYFNTSNIIVANGDSYFGVDLERAMLHFSNKKIKAMLTLKIEEDTSRYGRVEISKLGNIIKFCEKDGQHTAGLINAGIYFFSRDSIDIIDRGTNISLEKEVFPELINKQALYGYQAKGVFIDIGTPNSYIHAQSLSKHF